MKCNNAIVLILCVYLPYESETFYNDYNFCFSLFKIPLVSDSFPVTIVT